jgi:hypothetical protein
MATASKVVREGNIVVVRMQVARLIKLTRREDRYEIVDADAYIGDMMASLNRRADAGMTEIEQVFVREIEHVHNAGFESVRCLCEAA